MAGPPGLMSSGLFAGRYSIERVLGQGATATVHLARDTERGIAVAIKIMRPELAQSKATDRFLKEIRRTAQLQHPHILRVLDSGEHEGRPYFVLPYMEGGTLRTKLKRTSQLSFDETVSILRTVAEALDYAHTKGLIHRDVKPENILFTSGQACLGDFGIARALETVYGSTDGSSSSNTVRGTYAYMSPEQAAGGQNLDGRSDIYSLACVAYEMVTGMQAFIGPTPEAVVAQRFAYTPREVRVYRPSAPPEVDVALAGAFAMSPADRYKTATEFVEALAEAVTSTSTPTVKRRETPAGSLQDTKQRRMIGIGAVLALIAAVALLKVIVPKIRGLDGSPAVDTTRLVVLPLERDDSTNMPQWRDDDLLQQGLARYRDVSVVDQFQVSDAMTRHGPLATSKDGALVAASLGAGRYIRGRVTRFGNEWRVAASLYDAPSGKPLYQGRESLAPDIAGAAAAYARLADTLLLRGAPADSLPVGVIGSRSLPAVQAFGRAQLALDDWDLEAADSLFQRATLFDAEYARASLWLAQVRAWQESSRNTWGTIAERSLAMSSQLDERERRLANALVMLSKGSYDRACAVYETLRQRNDRDFAAWYGLGQCQMLNRIVQRDTMSLSGWSFRSSANRGLRAYEQAFELLPSVHRGYERGAFSRLRLTLRTTTSVLIGYGAADSAQFYSRVGWLGDSLAFIPYPWMLVAVGEPRTQPPNFAVALRNRREAFRRIAASWSSAYPTSSAAKYGVAVALETLGDPSAVDTIRLARSLATDSVKRSELGAYEALLLFKFGFPDDTSRLRRAALLADSLLRAAQDLPSAADEILTQVAMIVGACASAERLAQRVQQRPGPQAVKAEIWTESQRLLARIGSGCNVPQPSIAAFATMVDREARPLQESQRQLLFDKWLSRPVLLATDLDKRVLRLLASESPDPFAKALSSYLSRGDDSARANLSSVVRPSADTLTPPTPDITLPRARAAVAIGDTSAAVVRLDRILRSVRAFDPQVLSENMRTGPLIRAAVFRADIANAQGDRAAARRWATAVSILLERADPELKPELSRMKSYLNN